MGDIKSFSKSKANQLNKVNEKFYVERIEVVRHHLELIHALLSKQFVLIENGMEDEIDLTDEIMHVFTMILHHSGLDVSHCSDERKEYIQDRLWGEIVPWVQEFDAEDDDIVYVMHFIFHDLVEIAR